MRLDAIENKQKKTRTSERESEGDQVQGEEKQEGRLIGKKKKAFLVQSKSFSFC